MPLRTVRVTAASHRYRAARDAVVLFEAPAGQFQRFWVEAVSFWCDAGPVLERASAGVLERLGALCPASHPQPPRSTSW